MALLSLQNSALVLSLEAVQESKDTLVAQVQHMIPQSRFLILNIKGVAFTTLLIGDIVNVLNLFEEHWKDQSHRIMFVQADPSARRILDLTKLSKKFPVYDSIEKAIEDLPPIV